MKYLMFFYHYLFLVDPSYNYFLRFAPANSRNFLLRWDDTAVAAFAKKFLPKPEIKVDVRERATCSNIAGFQCLIILVAFSVEFEVDCQVFPISFSNEYIFLHFLSLCNNLYLCVCLCVAIVAKSLEWIGNYAFSSLRSRSFFLFLNNNYYSCYSRVGPHFSKGSSVLQDRHHRNYYQFNVRNHMRF